MILFIPKNPKFAFFASQASSSDIDLSVTTKNGSKRWFLKEKWFFSVKPEVHKIVLPYDEVWCYSVSYLCTSFLIFFAQHYKKAKKSNRVNWRRCLSKLRRFLTWVWFRESCCGRIQNYSSLCYVGGISNVLAIMR